MADQAAAPLQQLQLRLDGANTLVGKLPNFADFSSMFSGSTGMSMPNMPEGPESRLDLDDTIGNDDGHFVQPGGGFSRSARNVRLQGTELHAELRTKNGNWLDSTIDLGNIFAADKNGNFVRVH